MKFNKYLLTIFILFFPSKVFNQVPCDSSSFKQLIKFHDSVEITDNDLKKCCHIVDSLLKNNCTYFILKREYHNYFTLTSIFGDICVKANSTNSVKAYIDYYLKNPNSPEEQLEYSLEDIFFKRPKDVLNEIVKRNSSERGQLLFGLAFGFGETYNSITPLDTINYQKKFFSQNADIITIYPTFKKEIDSILIQIKNMLIFSIKMDNESNK
jgi:hypothetical protein